MASVFRQAPGRLRLTDLVSKGGVSQLVADDFFEAAGTVYYGILRCWDGSLWQPRKLAVYTGSWQVLPLYFWDGAAWRLVNTTGIE